MLVTPENLKTFSGVHPDNDDLIKIYIGSAEDIIKQYVGFDPETNQEWKKSQDVEVIVYSDDREHFYSDEEMTKAVVIPDGVIVQPTLIENQYEYIIREEYIDVPDIFKMVCLEIATLLQQEENENLGVNNKTFGEGGSRSFLNIVDYTKYLKRLGKYRRGDALKF